MFKIKLIELGIPELSPIITSYCFQIIGMFIVQLQSQALKVFKQFIIPLQEENPRVTRIIIHNNGNIPPTAHRANTRGTDSVHMKQMFGLLSHYGVNRRMECTDHLAMTTRSINKVTLKLEQGQSSEKA
jgi:hypothetical protein